MMEGKAGSEDGEEEEKRRTRCGWVRRRNWRLEKGKRRKRRS